MSGGSTDRARRCDFCRLPCPLEPVTAVYDDVTYEFCSPSCRAALAESDRVFTEYHGHRRFRSGVAGVDACLPEGIPRDSFVLVTGEAGTRETAVHAELVWRTLQRGEPAVLVSFLEPPMSVIGTFVKMDWNVLPYLDRGDLQVLDCFTHLRDDGSRKPSKIDQWNEHLTDVLSDATTVVRDPSDTAELANKLQGVLADNDMVDRGLVALDSLTEFGSLIQPVQAYDFVKTIRADVSKACYVPLFAGATYAGEGTSFPHDLDYIADGVVDMELHGSIVEDTLIKRIRVRKMNGVLAIPEWRAYEYTAGLGMVTFDPEEERAAGGGNQGSTGGGAQGGGGPPRRNTPPAGSGRGGRGGQTRGGGQRGGGAAENEGRRRNDGDGSD